MRMWLLRHPMIDAIHKSHLGCILEQPRRQVIRPTIIFIIIMHVWIQVSGIKVHITLGLVLNIILNIIHKISDIDHLFLQLSFFQKLDLSIITPGGSLFLCSINFPTQLCLEQFQLFCSSKTMNNFIIVRWIVRCHLDMFCH